MQLLTDEEYKRTVVCMLCFCVCVSPLQLNNNSKLPFLLLFRHVVFYFRALILLYYKFDVRPINLNRDKATPFIRVNLSHNLL